MSEKIKITVVTDNEKQNTENEGKYAVTSILTQESSVTLMSVLLKNHLISGSFCGGRGDCGQCIVQFLEGAPLPTQLERSRLEPEELRQGFRLACLTRPKTDCKIRIVNQMETERTIIAEMIPPSENIDLNSRQNELSENQIVPAIESGEKEGNIVLNAIKNASVISQKEAGVMKYIVAVDLGTTTIAMQLRELCTGKVVDIYCEMNPQRTYGTDVLSRIQASCDGHREDLRRMVCGALERGLAQFVGHLGRLETDGQGSEKCAGRVSTAGRNAATAAQIAGMCIAGNTAMEHLLLGYDVSTLGRSPFIPVETGLQELQSTVLFKNGEDDSSGAQGRLPSAEFAYPVYIMPCISAFVGGDIAAGLYALQMLPDICGKAGKEREMAAEAVILGETEKPGLKTERKSVSGAKLLIDLGTNGEMAITDGSRMLVTATAAGPAFEGGRNKDLVGTDRIALTAGLLQKGILDETGLLTEPYFSEGVPVETSQGIREETSGEREKSKCYFMQKDIRDLQMAKAAVRAGVEILWKELDCPTIERVYLAGGFGYFLDVDAALAIGLLPGRLQGRIQAVGNTSLEGAYLLGRDLVTGAMTKRDLEKALNAADKRRLCAVNLAKQEGFEALYVKYMNLERN